MKASAARGNRSVVISPSLDQAREKFEELLRNHLGLMSEDTHHRGARVVK